MEFEVGGKAVEVEDEGSQVEWGDEAEGGLLRGEGPDASHSMWTSLLCNTFVEIAVRFQPPLHHAAV